MSNRKSALEFIKLNNEMHIVYFDMQKNGSIKKTADSGMLDGLVHGTVEKIKSMWDPDHKVASILNFLTPAILSLTGFGWFAILWEVAGALGFDGKKFFSGITDAITGPVEKAVNGGSVSHDEILQPLQQLAQNSTNGADAASDEAFMAAMNKSSSAKNILLIKKLAMHKGASWTGALLKTFTKIMPGVGGWFAKTIAWIVIMVLAGLGLAVGGGAAKKVLEDKGIQPLAPSGKAVESPVHQELLNQAINPGASGDITEKHFNDLDHIWILNFSPSKIGDKLKEWAQELYGIPANKVSESPKFQEMIQAYKKRNKDAGETGISAAPDGYTSIKQMVDSFAGEVLSKMKESAKK